MATATTLTAFLNADTTKFDKGMKRAGKSMKSFGKAVKLGTAAAGVAVAGVGVALGALAKRQAGVIDETAKLSNALGVNIREFQALALAGSEAGITQDQLGNMITKSQRSIVEASRGLETYARSFKTLGLDVNELMSMRPDQQFDAIAVALSEIESPTLRTATALEIFGRSGRQVINMLDGYVENVQAAREFNDKWGISLSRIDASKVEEANDTFARVGQAVAGLGNQIAVYLAPLVTHVSNLFLEGGFDAETFGNAIKSAMSVAGKAIDIVRMAVLGLKALMTEFSLAVDLAILDASTSLFKFGEIVARVPGFKEMGDSLKEGMLTLNEAAQMSASSNIQKLKDLNAEASKFETMAKKIEKIQAEANARAEARGAGDENRDALDLNDILDDKAEKTKKVTKETEKMTDAQKEAVDNAKELGRTFTSAFEDAVIEGKKFSDVLQSLADDIQRILLRRVVTEPLDDFLTGAIGSLGGGGGGGSNIVAGEWDGLFGGIGDAIGGLFGGITPFARGTNEVPKDMIAQIHRGEMIVPAYDAAKMRNGGMGGNVNVIINNNAGANVEATARDNGNGTELNILIDEAVAGNIAKKGSRTNAALSSFQNQSRIRR